MYYVDIELFVSKVVISFMIYRFFPFVCTSPAPQEIMPLKWSVSLPPRAGIKMER